MWLRKVSSGRTMELKRELSFFAYFSTFLYFKHAHVIGVFELLWGSQHNEWTWLKIFRNVVTVLLWRSCAEATSLSTVTTFARRSQTIDADASSRRHKHIPVSQRWSGVSCSFQTAMTHAAQYLISSFSPCSKHLSPCRTLHPCQEMAQASLFGSTCCVSIFTHPWEQEKKMTLAFISSNEYLYFTDEQNSTCIFTLT